MARPSTVTEMSEGVDAGAAHEGDAAGDGDVGVHGEGNAARLTEDLNLVDACLAEGAEGLVGDEDGNLTRAGALRQPDVIGLVVPLDDERLRCGWLSKESRRDAEQRPVLEGLEAEPSRGARAANRGAARAGGEKSSPIALIASTRSDQVGILFQPSDFYVPGEECCRVDPERVEKQKS